MTHPPWIKVNGRTYLQEELPDQPFENSAPDFEKSALAFCKDWLGGKQEFVIHTSGSTGAPKQIKIFRAQMEASARNTIEALHLKAGETSLVGLDTQYIAGQMMLVRSLLAGMNIVVVEPSANPLDKVADLTIDFVALVPYQLENCIAHSSDKLNRVRCALIGGAAIHHSLQEKIKYVTCALYATYGMTETISHIALQRLNGKNAQDFFEAFNSVDLRLDDRGCLCINVNYLGQEFITNDLVELVGERKFKWLGRIDNVINSGGIKVIPEKVEAAFERILDSFQIKNRFFACGMPDAKLGSKVTLVFEGRAFAKEIQQQMIGEAAKLISKYEVPKEILFVAQFKETATGKVNRPATLASIESA